MARYRSIHSDISVDDSVSSLFEHGPWAVLLYTWAILQADDYGRLTGNARQFKLTVCPGADITTAEVEVVLQQIADAGLWERYEVNGKQFIAFPFKTWIKHQSYIPRRKFATDSSKIPAPNGWEPLQNANTPPVNEPDPQKDATLQTGESLSGQDNAIRRHKTPLNGPTPTPTPTLSPAERDGETREGEQTALEGGTDAADAAHHPSKDNPTGEAGKGEDNPPLPPEKPTAEPKSSRRAPTTRMLADWEPNPETRAKMATECPTLDLDQATAEFRDFWIGEGEVKADWNATWRNDMRAKQARGKCQISSRMVPVRGVQSPPQQIPRPGGRVSAEEARRNIALSEQLLTQRAMETGRFHG